tara:strand:- start:708 stop:1049 length:342 start_codon:yes stop_codon:yes gene_type:complete
MVKVLILPELVRQIQKIFKKKSYKIFDLIEELEVFPNKGKLLGNVGRIVIKEIKYEVFRFYFIADGQKIKCVTSDELKNLLIKFVRMSDKDTQQKTINEIKLILNEVGFDDFK